MCCRMGTLARESARETFKNMVKQLQRGVRTGAFEPWLMWLTRSDALRYTQVEHPPEVGTRQSETPPKNAEKAAATLADARVTKIMNRPALEGRRITARHSASCSKRESGASRRSITEHYSRKQGLS